MIDTLISNKKGTIMKKLLLLSVLLLGASYSYCWDVKLANNTKHKIRFIIKNNQWKCKDGDLMVEANKSSVFNFKHNPYPCTRGTCPSSIVANIQVSDDKVVQLNYNIGDSNFSAGDIATGGFQAGSQVANPMQIGGGSGNAGAVIVVGALLVAGGAELYKGLKKATLQCHAQTITISGDGGNAGDYKLQWQWGLK
jgi:hypothetical protein